MQYALWELWFRFKRHYKRNPGINTFCLGIFIMAIGVGMWVGNFPAFIVVLGVGCLFVAVAVGQPD